MNPTTVLPQTSNLTLQNLRKMSFPPLAGGDHAILSSEFCSGYTDISGIWNTGFYCPQAGSNLAVFCCGTPIYKYCCTNKPENGTGAGIVEEIHPGVGGGVTGVTSTDSSVDGGSEYSGATRMRPLDDKGTFNLNGDLTSLNLSDVPIIFGVACGVAAVLILVILAGFYLTSCCAHYHQLHQNRKRRSSTPGIYRGVTTTNASTTSGLVDLYSPTNSAGGAGAGGGGVGSASGALSTDNPQTYIVHHHLHNPPGSPDSCSTSADHYQMAGGSSSLVTTPLDIEWSSTAQYLQKPQPTSSSASQLQQSQPFNILSSAGSNHIDNRIQYTVHQTQNRLAVALTGSMNRLSDRASPCPPTSSFPVNIPLTPPDGYSYPRPIPRGLSPPPQYSSSLLARAESPPYYPSYDSGSSSNTTDNLLMQHSYLSRTSTLPLSLTRKPPTGSNRPMLTSPGPYGTQLSMPQQPKSILRTSQNYRRVVTNETPPPIPPHTSPAIFGGPAYHSNNNSMDEASGMIPGVSLGNVAYRNVDCWTNLGNQPLLLLESQLGNGALSSGDNGDLGDDDEEVENQNHLQQQGAAAIAVRRASISTGINTTVTAGVEEEEDESRDQFDIHDIDSDALSRLIELDLDSKL